MHPLQLGETDALFAMLAIVALAAVIIIVVLTLKGRTSAMSDELSKQSEAKFRAIAPSAASATRPPTREDVKKTYPPTPTDRVRDEGSLLPLRKELLETRFQLENYIRDNAPRVERQRQIETMLEKLESELSGFRDRLTGDAQEIQKLKASVSEQNIRLHSQRRDIDNQRIDIGKISERSEMEKLKAEFGSVSERLLASEKELQKLGVVLEEQNTNLKQLRDIQAQTPGPIQATRVIQAAPPLATDVTPPKQPVTDVPLTQPQTIFPSKNCVRCGAQLESLDRYCIHCGQLVA